MTVQLKGPSMQSLTVPGVFAGDGQSGSTGTVWQAFISVDEPGTWSYEVTFVKGDNAAVTENASTESSVEPDGQSGKLCIPETATSASGFYASGKLTYAGDHYLHDAEGNPWLKGGTNSPENFLGYAGFDNTIDQPGGGEDGGLEQGLHHFSNHEADWNEGDPDWNNGDGKAIIGALNYLADQGINSIYLMLCNLEGDGREVYPYVSPQDFLHFDISKLAQWNIVFSHAQKLGIALHLVFNEIENEKLLDDGTLGTNRRLYYREMVARFAHHPAVFWNIGEESTFGVEKLEQFSDYIRTLDAYKHPTAVHTAHDGAESQYAPLLGSDLFTSTSLQITPVNTNQQVEYWRQQSDTTAQPWVVMVDEPKEAQAGLIGGGGLTNENYDEYRRLVLWPAYLSGAGGVEWYFSGLPLPLGDDLRAEDFRMREPMWHYTKIAREFLLEHLPFSEMQPNDALLAPNPESSGQVFAKPNEVYAIYLPNAEDSHTLNLSQATGSFQKRWFNPRTGNFDGETKAIEASANAELGNPPSDASNDWVVLITR